MSWICSQIGAREHYAIPRALQSVDMLDRLCTDLPRNGIRTIDRKRVHTFTLGGARWALRQRRRGLSYDDFIQQGAWFSKQVARKVKGASSHEKPTFFGYDTGFLEAAHSLKLRGYDCLVGQMDPGRVEFDLVAEERKRWPGWEDDFARVPEAYHHRREQEWEIADRIIVNSDWSRSALVKQGVVPEKIVVVPLAYEPTFCAPPPKMPRERLQVLWLGSVNLRKGFPYFLEAAQKMRNEPVDFLVVGPIQISTRHVSAPKNLRFLGPITRARTGDFYRDADVLALPTLSDGFAITQIEAMAHGLPVITTANCGDVVTHGKDGFLIPPRDSRSLIEATQRISEDRHLLRKLSDNALLTSRRYGLDRLSRNLLRLP